MKKEKIYLQNNKGQKLVGILYKPEQEKETPLIIYSHGYRSTKESSKVMPLAQALVSKEISLLAFDFSGRGESEGKFEDTTLTQYIDDLKCVVDYASKLVKQIGIIGNSLGGIVALQEVTKDKRVKSLVLLSPASVFPHSGATKEFKPENIQRWKEKGYIFTESEKFGKLKINYSFYEDILKYGHFSVYNNIIIPVLVIHGTEDQSIPVEYSQKLVQHLAHSRLVLFEGADHNYTKEYVHSIIRSSLLKLYHQARRRGTPPTGRQGFQDKMARGEKMLCTYTKEKDFNKMIEETSQFLTEQLK